MEPNQNLINETVLTLVNSTGAVPLRNLNNYIIKSQQDAIFNLIEEGYLIVSLNDTIPHQSFEELTITQKGKAYLFKLNYPRQVKLFYDELIVLGFDVTLFDEFLEAQNFNKTYHTILIVNNFVTFEETYHQLLTV